MFLLPEQPPDARRQSAMSEGVANPLVFDLSRHYRELWAFVQRRVQCPALAADIVQDSYLRVAAKPSIEPVENPEAYLYRTAANLVADHWRASARQPLQLDEHGAHAHIADMRPTPEAEALSREELAVMAEAIQALPPRTREVFKLHKFEHLSYGEIADRLGIAKNTVVVHMVRALAQCRRQLAGYHRGEAAAASRDGGKAQP